MTPFDLDGIMRFCAREYHYTPAQVGALTLTQLRVLMAKDGERGPVRAGDTVHFSSIGDWQKWRAANFGG